MMSKVVAGVKRKCQELWDEATQFIPPDVRRVYYRAKRRLVPHMMTVDQTALCLFYEYTNCRWAEAESYFYGDTNSDRKLLSAMIQRMHADYARDSVRFHTPDMQHALNRLGEKFRQNGAATTLEFVCDTQERLGDDLPMPFWRLVLPTLDMNDTDDEGRHALSYLFESNVPDWDYAKSIALSHWQELTLDNIGKLISCANVPATRALLALACDDWSGLLAGKAEPFRLCGHTFRRHEAATELNELIQQRLDARLNYQKHIRSTLSDILSTLPTVVITEILSFTHVPKPV